MAKMADTAPSTPPQQLRFGRHALPALSAGTYTLEARLSMEGAGIPQSPFEAMQFPFEVSAPQLGMPPALIHAVYPASGALGAFQGTLPELVLARETLPWERQGPSSTEHEPQPWMALLLLTEAELADEALGLGFRWMEARGIGDAAPGLLAPRLTLGTGLEGTRAEVLEMNGRCFRMLAPTHTDMRLLAHTRQVGAAGRLPTGEPDEDRFAVVLCNRTPQAGQRHVACLVSTEGMDAAWQAAPSDDMVLRLVVLHRWAFDCAGASAEEMGRALAQNVRPLMLALDSQHAPEGLQVPLQYGYMPLNHQWRGGKDALAWYRGPLVPVAVDAQGMFSVDAADDAFRFDDATGMYDISYAAAWQLGRILGLQDAGYLGALREWATGERARRLDDAIRVVSAQVGMSTAEATEAARAVEEDAALLHLVLDAWLDGLAGQEGGEA